MVLRTGAWQKSSYSGEEGACVEAALARAEVLVRDSKDPALPVQQHRAPAWRAFLNHLVRLA
jgi:hypothetical protein